MENKSGVRSDVLGLHQIPNSLPDDPFTSFGVILWTRIHLSCVYWMSGVDKEQKETERF